MRKRLDLGRHCIETEIRKTYNAKISWCLKQNVIDHTDEEEIEALKYALEFFDFSALRARFPELSGGSNAAVFLITAPEGGVMIELNNEPVSLLL